MVIEKSKGRKPHPAANEEVVAGALAACGYDGQRFKEHHLREPLRLCGLSDPRRSMTKVRRLDRSRKRAQDKENTVRVGPLDLGLAPPGELPPSSSAPEVLISQALTFCAGTWNAGTRLCPRKNFINFPEKAPKRVDFPPRLAVEFTQTLPMEAIEWSEPAASPGA